MIDYKKSELKNGIRVVTENHPDSKAIALGIWIEVGTRDEPAGQVGISHFLEHLVFKGTQTRSAYEIARAFEAVGGEINAYTTREYTVFHGLVLNEDWSMALDILSDLVRNARFEVADIDLERSVVKQEIAMSPDSPEEYAFDLYFEEAYRGHPMGRPILGTEESLDGMGLSEVQSYYQTHYAGPRIIVSAAGGVDHAAIVGRVEELLGALPAKAPTYHRTVPKHLNFRQAFDRPSEQCHLLIGMESIGFTDPLRFDAYIVNALLGGGMISKLYQSVREKRGLVYSIYSSLTSSIDSGILTVYAGTEKKFLPQVLEAISQDLSAIRKNGVAPEDIELFKHQVRGSILLGSDDVENRMTSLGVNEMVFHEYRPVESVIREVCGVSQDSVQQFIERFMTESGYALLLLGEDLKSDGLDEAIKNWSA